MELPSPQEVKLIIERVEAGGQPTWTEAKALVSMIYSLMTPDHTWWRPPPIPPGQIMLLANDETITPPMIFQTADEAAMFAKMNKTVLYIPIPKPTSIK